MEIKVYKTNEIEESLWQKIVDGFNQSFEGKDTTINHLVAEYKSNTFGYSYHAVCSDGDKLVGFNSIIPHYYIHNGNKILLGLSGSTFVLREYRKDIFIFSDIYNALKEYCVKEHFIAFLGVPNKNSYNYFIKFLNCKEVLSLSYYILPLHISKIYNNKLPSFLNMFSGLYSLIVILFNALISGLLNPKEQKVAYQISLDEEFLKCRFISERYKKIEKGNIKAWYRIMEENGVQTAYLMDFRENDKKSFRALWYSVWMIYTNKKVDIIMYIGTMNFKQSLLTKVPDKFEPKRLPLTFTILDIANPELYADMGNHKKWDFGLLNLDVK